MAWLLSLLSVPAAWLLKLILPILEADLVKWVTGWIADFKAQREAARIAKANDQKLKDAIKSGDQDAIEKAGGDLLNGDDPNP